MFLKNTSPANKPLKNKIVAETERFLLKHEEKATDDTVLRQIRMLLALRRDSSQTLDQVAATVGCSRPTIERWLRNYRTHGIEFLHLKKTRGRPKSIPTGVASALRDKMDTGELGSMEEALEWVRAEAGVACSEATLASALANGNAAHYAPVLKRKSGKPDVSDGYSSNHLLTFLNSLPVTTEIVQWANLFRKALMLLLKDVDRISLDINSNCDLEFPGRARTDIRLSQTIVEAGQSKEIEAHPFSIESVQVELMEAFRVNKFPFDRYQTPSSFIFLHRDLSYLGTIILWREVGRAPISEETLLKVQGMRPFLSFMLSDAVARCAFADESKRTFFQTLDTIFSDAHLTSQEQRVISLRLAGDSYKVIASKLRVSQNAVRKHLTNIHRKTDTRGLAEFFAKYFGPMIQDSVSAAADRA